MIGVGYCILTVTGSGSASGLSGRTSPKTMRAAAGMPAQMSSRRHRRRSFLTGGLSGRAAAGPSFVSPPRLQTDQSDDGESEHDRSDPGSIDDLRNHAIVHQSRVHALGIAEPKRYKREFTAPLSSALDLEQRNVTENNTSRTDRQSGTHERCHREPAVPNGQRLARVVAHAGETRRGRCLQALSDRRVSPT